MLGDLLRETFPGFDKEALRFLKDLKSPSKNNKEWFDRNRERYETFIKEPMKHLVDTLAGEIMKTDPDIVVNYKSIFRINRDIRFSKVKTPYKTISSAAFAFGRVKSAEIPQFYFHFSSDEFLFASGQYSMDPDLLKKIRKHIAENFDEYESIVKDRRFRSKYGDVQGEALTRLPKEFSAAGGGSMKPALQKALMMKQYYVFETEKPEVVLSEKIVKRITDGIELTYDFTKFLTDAIRKN
ncbi:MAG: DUF2461 domain-containing protein [Ignavibacteria bacterium]|nr:DUF2461 domain-containing protein [Ignavibacteria bacterium]